MRTWLAIVAILAAPAFAEEPDSSGVVADSLGAEAAADSAEAKEPPPPLFQLDALAAELETFRVSRSVDVDRVPFRSPDDPIEPAGLETITEVLRVRPEIRTRELSQGPTLGTYEIRGGGTGRAGLVWPGREMALPGTSGPTLHDVFLTEISGVTIVRGGAAALYGPGSVSGATIVSPRRILPDDVLSRASAEEGVDDLQRGAFQVSRRLGRSAGFFLATESRRFDGLYPGTAERGRHYTFELRGRLSGTTRGEIGVRHYEGDGRTGFLVPPIRSLRTRRHTYYASLFRRLGEDRGALLQASLLSARLRHEGGGEPTSTRDFETPSAQLTADLPALRGWRTTARLEWSRWALEDVEGETTDRFTRSAAALRTLRTLGPGAFVTATGRVDLEEDRRRGLQLRLESEWGRGPAALFGILSRNERIPDRGAAGEQNEIHESATLGARVAVLPVTLRGTVYSTTIHDLRPDPTFAEVEARAPQLGAPIGDAEVSGTTVGMDTELFQLPGLRPVGHFQIETSLTWLTAENDDTGERLPGRPKTTWTGQGSVERRFFRDEMLARLRGRLTHYGDRVNDAGEGVRNAWVTDVHFEGEIGDVVFYFRFHDLLERSDEIEPGVYFPGFSRSYGLTWRFVG